MRPIRHSMLPVESERNVFRLVYQIQNPVCVLRKLIIKEKNVHLAWRRWRWRPRSIWPFPPGICRRMDELGTFLSCQPPHNEWVSHPNRAPKWTFPARSAAAASNRELALAQSWRPAPESYHIQSALAAAKLYSPPHTSAERWFPPLHCRYGPFTFVLWLASTVFGLFSGGARVAASVRCTGCSDRIAARSRSRTVRASCCSGDGIALALGAFGFWWFHPQKSNSKA